MMMMPKRPQTSPGSVLSLRGGASVPGSPATAIVARVDDGVMVYKDLAALPRDKAILDIERPDLMTYELHYNYSPLEVSQSLSPGSFSPPTSPEESRAWLGKSSPAGSSPASSGRKRSGNTTPSPHTQHTLHTEHTLLTQNIQPSKILQHFHRPDNGSNIYRKPPIYRRGASSSALPAGKHLEDLIIESSKFPAAEPPNPNAPSKIETEHWPCPPSAAVFDSVQPGKDHPEGGAGQVNRSHEEENSLATGPQPECRRYHVQLCLFPSIWGRPGQVAIYRIQPIKEGRLRYPPGCFEAHVLRSSALMCVRVLCVCVCVSRRCSERRRRNGPRPLTAQRARAQETSVTGRVRQRVRDDAG
ncbi:dematin-like isoform X12 [Phycodurus eques]|uniref:dematin-like isoform X12 n=1 Tax=Phycodurus eques TaxID=693459 RepID=UPI002ACD76C9|nr:dematin-like isoform X12 [Phycodurus eques]